MSPKTILFSNSEEKDTECGCDEKYLKAVPSAKLLKTLEHGTIIAVCPFDDNEEIYFIDKGGNIIN